MCVSFVIFTPSLTDGSNFKSSLAASAGVAVELTIEDNGKRGDRRQFLV